MKKILLGLALALAFCVPAYAQQLGQATALYSETATALTGSATYTGSAHDVGPIPYYDQVGCVFRADQSGTAYLDMSADASAWTVQATASVSANTTTDLNARVRARFWRCRYVNGSTGQGSFAVFASATVS
ncbi:hypothetical protein [uncultured Devosia sp.]|uniref:hypothetical protein n=1 Tax=uncultured Devosia sp. TaxID=211434 RepID=UPI002618F7A8|nr:hypothetical protein [uncultured Devosia sp.]